MREIPELSIRGGELRRQYSNGTDLQWTLSLLTATLRLPLPVTAMRQVSQSWPTSETPFFFPFVLPNRQPVSDLTILHPGIGIVQR